MMLIPAHREVMNLVYYQDNRRGSRDRWRSDKHRQDAHVLGALLTGGADRGAGVDAL